METYRYNVSVSIVNPGTILDTSIRQKNLTSILANEKPDVEIKSVANSDYQEWIAFTRKRLKRADAERIGDSPIIVSEAIYHAISHKYPRTRYIVGRVGKFPCWLMNLMKVVLPDRLFDMLLLAAPEAG